MCKKCFLCDELFNDSNKSKEHIIKNSIGGRKKVSNFICISCNSKTGKDWDSSIDKYFGADFSLLLGIKRERGKIPIKKVVDKESGDTFLLTNGKIKLHSPSYVFDENNQKHTITAPTKKRLNHFIKQLVSEGKLPEDIINKPSKTTKENIGISVEFKFIIPEPCSNFSKSIVKSSLALLADSKHYLALSSCVKAKNFLIKNAPPPLEYAYDYDVVTNRPFAVPFHCVHVFSETFA